MKPEFNSRRLFGITRSKGKMFEFGVDESAHIEIPQSDDPESLFLLAIGNLGDIAAAINSGDGELANELRSDLDFSAGFFDAFLAARFREDLDSKVQLLASAAYFVAKRPGSSLVMVMSLRQELDDPCEKFLAWLLRASWVESPEVQSPTLGEELTKLGRLISAHFNTGADHAEIFGLAISVREKAYAISQAYELLLVDLICAVARLRLASSAWLVLPKFTGTSRDKWAPVIARTEFPKELWPSQIRLGLGGLFHGASGVIQMPTSAGKTKSMEIVIRSAFLANRANLAVVVAPFRALCHEIATAMKAAFREEGIGVNELSDVLQRDYVSAFEVGVGAAQSKGVLILTPEKLLFVLRQMPSIIENIGVVVYDEGHQFDSGSRGITYELLLTEIRALLPPSAQTVLVSAVINNADAIGKWLVGDQANVVDGSGLLPTARSVAFASWMEQLGQLIFYESDDYARYDYFVPRVIQQRELERRGREGRRYFPDKRESRDVALFLGLKLSRQGAVAIFCGKKDSASGIAKRAVEIYGRAYDLPPPASVSSEEEVSAIRALAAAHFGEDSEVSKAAGLGVFVHHGNTPEGLRLSVEYAMQRGRIKFVACTSTLAQGVNLPIRYLIVSTVYQAGEKIKVRDFQNLIGRAGRAGMHTEGLVIFADSDTYDRRRSHPWKFESSIGLLNPANSEDVASSLLSLLDPFEGTYTSVHVPVDVLVELLFDDIDNEEWIGDFVRDHRRAGLKTDTVRKELRRRKSLLSSLESYLMANRGEYDFEQFRESAEMLASRTLAYSLATEEKREALLWLFRATADYIQDVVPDQKKQKVYGRTLLGAANAAAIERWVSSNLERIVQANVPDEILDLLWSLFRDISSGMFFVDVERRGLAKKLAKAWLDGRNYRAIFDLAAEGNGTRPWGEGRRKLGADAIVDFLDNRLAFDCALIVGAVIQVMDTYDIPEETARAFELFQKRLKYGLPDVLSISAYEFGFADRVVSLHIRDQLIERGYPMDYFNLSVIRRSLVRTIVSDFPSYFKTVVASRGQGL